MNLYIRPTELVYPCRRGTIIEQVFWDGLVVVLAPACPAFEASIPLQDVGPWRSGMMTFSC